MIAKHDRSTRSRRKSWSILAGVCPPRLTGTTGPQPPPSADPGDIVTYMAHKRIELATCPVWLFAEFNRKRMLRVVGAL